MANLLLCSTGEDSLARQIQAVLYLDIFNINRFNYVIEHLAY